MGLSRSIFQSTNANMCRIRKAKTFDEAVEFAKVALRGHLFVSGWALSGCLQAIKKREHNYRIAIAEEESKIVGVAIRMGYDEKLEDWYPTIMTYVIPAFRGRKIGSKLIKSVRPRKYDFAESGIKGSKEFWKKIGVKCF